MARTGKRTEGIMPKLKTSYEKQEEIPEGYGELYVEKDGKFFKVSE